MKKQRSKIHYDKENGVLSIEIKQAKSVDSDIQDNVVIDYDRRGKIVRINLYRFNFDAFRQDSKAIQRFAQRSIVPFSAK